MRPPDSRSDGRAACIKETQLKTLVSKAARQAEVVESAMRATGSRVPWLRIRPSSREKELSARDTAFWGT